MKLRDAIGQVEQGKAPSCTARTPEWGVDGGVVGVVADKTPIVASK